MFPDDVLAYIEHHKNDNTYSLLLKKSPFADYDMDMLVRQIQGRKVAQSKFPFLLAYDQYVFPPKVSLEQASSEKTGKYKQKLLNGESFADLTGGMGIDTFLLGNQFESCIYVEPNEKLFKTSIHNFDILGANQTRGYNTTCEDFLEKSIKKYDWLYLDPSRRIDGNRKTSISNYEPNIIELKDKLLASGQHIMIKLSPMQDISECVSQLKNIYEIFIISVKNDVKELLILLGQEECNNPKIRVVDLSQEMVEYVAHYSDKQDTIALSKPQDFLYQPAPALIKSELHNYYAKERNLKKIHPNTQLYTSEQKLDSYLGRVFKIESVITANKKEIKKHIPSMKANIITKNYPLSPKELGKKLKIKDGGDSYIIAFTNKEEQKVICACSRLK